MGVENKRTRVGQYAPSLCVSVIRVSRVFPSCYYDMYVGNRFMDVFLLERQLHYERARAFLLTKTHLFVLILVAVQACSLSRPEPEVRISIWRSSSYDQSIGRISS